MEKVLHLEYLWSGHETRGLSSGSVASEVLY